MSTTPFIRPQLNLPDGADKLLLRPLLGRSDGGHPGLGN